MILTRHMEKSDLVGCANDSSGVNLGLILRRTFNLMTINEIKSLFVNLCYHIGQVFALNMEDLVQTIRLGWPLI